MSDEESEEEEALFQHDEEEEDGDDEDERPELTQDQLKVQSLPHCPGKPACTPHTAKRLTLRLRSVCT